MGGFVTWGLALSAQAGVPVVFEGYDATEAIARVADRTGLPEEQLDALPMSQLRQTPPATRGDAVLRRCPTAPVAGDPVRTDYARAKAAFVKGDTFEAMDYLDLAVAKIGCLSEVVDAAVAAGVFVFRGALMITSGDADLAKTGRGELRTSIEMVRDLTFPDWLPTVVKPTFAEVLAEVEAADAAPLAKLGVVPKSTVSGPWVDGVEVAGSTDLRPGLHLLQYSSPQGIRSGWLSIGGAADVVLPGQVRGPVLDGMGQAEGQQLVAALVQAAVDELSAAYVAHNGGLWLVSKAESGFETVVVDEPESAAKGDAEGKKKKKGRKRR